MITTNKVRAVFGSTRFSRTHRLHQYDYGQILVLEGLELPTAYQVHFSNQPQSGTAKTQIGDENGVEIPDEYLLTGEPVFAWVFLHTGESDGETRYTVEIPVEKRPQPTEDEPTPVQQGVIDQAIAALNSGVERAENAADDAVDSAEDAFEAAERAAESAEEARQALDGKQDKLTFDQTPTAGSQNPVTSDGIYSAIQEATPSIEMDDYPTANSQRAAKSGGIYEKLNEKLDVTGGSIVSGTLTLSETNLLLVMGSKIIGLSAPETSTEPVTKGIFDTQVNAILAELANKLDKYGDTFWGDLHVGGKLTVDGGFETIGDINLYDHLLKNVGTPVLATDGANKAYVDNAIQTFFDSIPRAEVTSF